MLIIGLTGSFGTGKTTVAEMFKRLGARVLDADKIARTLTASDGICFKHIVRSFGDTILNDGEIDRRKLAWIVFDSPKDLKMLCAIIHPEVTKVIKKKITGYHKANNTKIVVIDAPLLIEAGLHKLSDYLIVVSADHKTQIKRIQKRTSLTKSQIHKRIRAQMSLKDKIRLADIVIDNKGTLRETQKQVEDVWQKLLKKKTKI